ncbi:MAG TPA: ammonium transporter [Phycisphaerae bacterium]|nr:ammonium transporter [Phycisphaerae bacterium]
MAWSNFLAQTSPPALDSGSTAWMLCSSALVLLMVPGLALFYGGMVRQKNVLTTMMHSFVAMAVIGVQWIAFGYAISFGQDIGGVWGWDRDALFLRGISHTDLYADKGIPTLLFVMFQGKFAIITPALISGAVAERVKFSSYIVFILLWSTLIYDPVAHWVWAPGGWLFQKGVLDFAGGTVVHITAGVSALALILLMGNRRDYPRGAILPNSLVLTLTGAGLLWFGWFGFNAGSAVAAGDVATLAFTTTQTAAAAAALAWLVIEWWHRGKATSLGVASGIIAGLVAITPAAGHVEPVAALVIGAVASLLCYGAVQLKGRLGYDDSLDAFGVHGVGGIWGALATGIFCTIPVKGLIDGNAGQFGLQALGVVAAAAYAFVGTLIIGGALKATIGLRCTDQQERDGLDIMVHGERGYHY